MKVDAEIQQKVLTLCGLKINNGLKIAVRERFYQLKLKEIEIEKAHEQFKVQQLDTEKTLADEVKAYEVQLDNLLKKAKAAPAVTMVKQESIDEMDLAVPRAEEMHAVTYEPEEEYFPEADIVKPVNKTPGVRVRMQEAVDDTSEGLTDEEVPIEFVEGSD